MSHGQIRITVLFMLIMLAITNGRQIAEATLSALISIIGFCFGARGLDVLINLLPK